MSMTISIRTRARGALLAVGISALSLPALAAVVSQSAPAAGAAVTRAAHSRTYVLPPALRPVFYRSLAKDAGTAYNVNKKGCATLPKQALTACFDAHGVHFVGGATPLSLHLVAYGRRSDLTFVGTVSPDINGNRVSYSHGNISAWWQVLPVGFEQGFTLAKRPAGRGELTLAIGANHGAKAQDDGLAWGRLRYGGLVVTDAKGKVVPATLKAQGDRVLIAVNDVQCTYPLTVDPLVWIEQKVTASDGAAGGQFGTSVVLDGTTALVGAPAAKVGGNALQGAVYVFTESDGVWTQTQKLTASDGAAVAEFGSGIALDGTTALIGAPVATVNDNTWQGRAYFFTESDGTWAQTQEVVANDGEEWSTFGQGVALSGNVAFIDAGGANVSGNPVPSSVYVFDESDGSWTQTQKIPSPNQAGDMFGYGAIIGISGTTAVVGAYAANVGNNEAQGNATVYTESHGIWTQAQQLTGSDSGAGDFFGTGVAIQGGTILVGAEYAEGGQGEVYVFTESNDIWTQTQQLSANDATSGDAFGSFVALDSPRALIGAVGYNSLEGKAYVFDNSAGAWSQTRELIPSDNPTVGIFGFAGALSATAAVVGASGVNSYQGAAYFYGGSNLDLAVSVPQTVGQGQQYVSQTIATNNASAASLAVSATITVPAAASFISAAATQGSCSEASGVVTCDFGQINGNAGTATANVTLKATGNVGDTIDNTASIAKATPPLSASAPTTITSGGACPEDYTEYDGILDAGKRARSPIYQAPAGEENAILTAPAGFKLFVVFQNVHGRKIFRIPGNEVHRQAPAGTFAWVVKAGDTGGAYTLCVLHP